MIPIKSFSYIFDSKSYDKKDPVMKIPFQIEDDILQKGCAFNSVVFYDQHSSSLCYLQAC